MMSEKSEAALKVIGDTLDEDNLVFLAELAKKKGKERINNRLRDKKFIIKAAL